MAGLRVHFVMPSELVERIDAALPVGVSRGEFVRRAVEQALGSSASRRDVSESSSPATGESGALVSENPAPAEQPEHPNLRGAYEVAAKGGLVGGLFQRAADGVAAGAHASNCKCPVCS